MPGNLAITPKGCIDSIYGRVQDDECPDFRSLSNWVADPTSPNHVVPRPAAVLLEDVAINANFIVLTSGTSWTVPADWRNDGVTVIALGAGGDGGAGVATVRDGSGGGGGACAQTTTFTANPGDVITYQIGVHGGTTGSGTTPTANTWLKDITTVVAAGGVSGGGGVGGAGGSVANSVGGLFKGGDGASQGTNKSGGGGGAAGPTGAGNGGTQASPGLGGQGDATVGGVGGTTTGQAGTAGTEWTALGAASGVGSGGGGAGATTNTSTVGGAGGAYGAGGGGGGRVTSAAGGAGTNGLIVIFYLPMMQPITCQTVVGNFVCGMMNDPSGTGTDVPFVFNLLNSTFLSVSGVTPGTNTPASPSGGDWQPPHAEPVGPYILISHPGFDGTGSNFYGAIGLSLAQLPKTVILTSGTSWVTPADWNNSDNTIECIGSGGTGANATTGGGGASGAGGHGGAYVAASNQTSSGTISIHIGTGGGPTWWKTTGTVQAAGGAAGSNVGTTIHLGGAGGSATAGLGAYGGGGGGGAGPAGVGLAGGYSIGGKGDNGTGGVGGSAGGGGGAGTEIRSTGIGSGGGGGGGPGSSSGSGGAGGPGGKYGAGGGGGGLGGGSGAAGAGAGGGQGVIIITYTPAPIPATWTVQNTATNALPSPPVWITQFNSRAYFACNPGGITPPSVLCSDVLGVATGPLSRSAAVAGVIFTFGDTTPLVGMGTMSLTNIATGGSVQALYIFKAATQGKANIYQITGDVGATGGINMQALNANVSTVAPNSVVSTPQGIFFVAPDGLRYIDTQGHVQNVIGYRGSGKVSPFLYALPQSRIAGACNASTLRYCMFNGATLTLEDWCLDLATMTWMGPHTFPTGLVNALGSSFIVTPDYTSGQVGIFKSDIIPSSTSVYTELGAPMTCIASSSFIPDRKDTKELSSVKSVLYAGGTAGAGPTTYALTCTDINGNVLGSASVAIPTTTIESAYDVPWTTPLVFDRMSMTNTVTAAAGVRLGILFVPTVDAGYTVKPAGY